MNKKAIECIRLLSTMIDSGEKHSEQSREIERQALAALDQPECKTCGGSGILHCSSVTSGAIACPGCQQPEPSEFTKDALLAIKCDDGECLGVKPSRNCLKAFLREACDIINTLLQACKQKTD